MGYEYFFLVEKVSIRRTKAEMETVLNLLQPVPNFTVHPAVERTANLTLRINVSARPGDNSTWC